MTEYNDHDANLTPETTEGSCMAGAVPEEAVGADKYPAFAFEVERELEDLYASVEDVGEALIEETEEQAADEGDEESDEDPDLIAQLSEMADEVGATALAALQYPRYLAHRFVPIHRSNWTAGRQGQRPQFVVIHIMEGSYAGSISWAQNPVSNVSWHYACARDGHTTQNLGEQQTAWTNSVWWYNIRSVAIEHGGFCRYGGPTTAQLHASAKLTAGICLRNRIPIDRKHIFGHTEIPGVTKPCPCKWPWKRYMRLVRMYARKG